MVDAFGLFGPATSVAQLRESIGTTATQGGQEHNNGSTSGPFLSVVVRTQGRRASELAEALVCLGAQTVDDFEVIIVGHDLSEAEAAEVRRLIDESMPSLREQISLLTVKGGTRARPLNVGFDHARGSYVVALDDDDLVFAHWVETFRDLATVSGGRVLRAQCVWQEHELLTVHGTPVAIATKAPETPHGEPFSIVRHLWTNETPFMTVAFPRAIHEAGIVRFDESLSTLEDWDYLLHVASLTGVVDSPEITSLYRRWANAANATAMHTEQEWVDNLERIERKLDSRTLVLPPGELAVMRALFAASPGAEGGESRRRVATETLREEALSLVRSRSWKMSKPLRFAGRLLGRQPAVDEATILTADRTHLLRIIHAVRTSRSWHLARVVRPTADES